MSHPIPAFTHVKDEPTLYRIGFYGMFDASWADWFDHMSLCVHYDRGASVTTLYGTVKDQAALHGLLARIRDLGLILMFVERESEGMPDAAALSPITETQSQEETNHLCIEED